jgi:hypothetical protein
VDGDIVAAAQEERFTREAGFPSQAVALPREGGIDRWSICRLLREAARGFVRLIETCRVRRAASGRTGLFPLWLGRSSG